MGTLRSIRWTFQHVLALSLAGLLGGQAHAQVMQAKFVPADGDPDDQFGWRVALSKEWAFVASRLDDDVQLNSGAIYVHQRIGDAWGFSQKLKQPAPGFSEELGVSVAASDDWMVAGAWHAEPGGVPNAGAAYVFVRQGSTWAYHQQLVASDFASGLTNRFGETAAMDGSVMLIGMPRDTFTNQNSGSAYVFELQGGSWVETSKLAPESPQDWEANSQFGAALDVSGSTLVVGAFQMDNGVVDSDLGAAYVFEWNGSAWVQTQKLLPDDGVLMDYFGSGVAISGDTILVGASGHQHTPGPNQDGGVYVFTKVAGAWVQTQELAPSDPWVPLGLGGFMDVEGDLAIIGAGADADLGSLSGSGYAFRRVAGTWEQFGKLLAPDGMVADVLCGSPRLSGTTVLANAYGDDDACNDLWQCNVGAAYVFELAPDTQQYSSCLSSGICGNHDDHGGCTNSTGQGAVLAAGGTTSTSADTLWLETRWLPPDVFGILFMGGSKNWLPFGDGRLAVGSGATGVYRILPAKSSGPEGAMIWNGGLVAQSQSLAVPGHIDPGETWYFQTWYRDPNGPCGSGFNVSNGLQVDFTP